MKGFINSNEPHKGEEQIRATQGGTSTAPALKAEIQGQEVQFEDHIKHERGGMK